MFFRLKTTTARNLFNFRCKGILSTPPVKLNPSAGFTVLSQLCHADMLMYLVAIKSFARQLNPAAILIVNDGSLTPEDQELLRNHLPGAQIHEASQFRLPHCPRGGAWERLIAISTFVHDSYIIQLDSDTLTFTPIQEVADSVRENRSFAIGTWDNQRPESMQERLDVARIHAIGPKPHVQLVAEANLDAIRGFESMRYIRGCAGFSGFARGSFNPEQLDQLSRQMGAALGERWNEWGSEQFMSNVIVANSQDPRVLPHPKYCDCTRYEEGKAAFVHFIGTCRFTKGRYSRAARQIIRELTPGDGR
jgi:hypothetical protein